MDKVDAFDDTGESQGYISLDQAVLRARADAKEEEPDILIRVGWDEIVWEEKEKRHNEDSYRVLLQFRRPGHNYREEQTGVMEFIFDLQGTQLDKQYLAWPKPTPPTKVSQVKDAITKKFPARVISKAASGVLSRSLSTKGAIRHALRRPKLTDTIAVVRADITKQGVDTIVNAPMQNPCREGTAIWIVCQAAIERRTLAEVRAELDRHASGAGARLLEYKGDLRNEKKLDIHIEGDRLVCYGPLGRERQ